MFLHYFNPGSEEAIGAGVQNYTPSANVQCMFKDLACLPLWYADLQDYVWVESSDTEKYVKDMRSLFPDLPKLFPAEAHDTEAIPIQAAPWGLAPNSLRAYQHLKKQRSLLLTIPEWKDVYRKLVSRETAQEVLQRLTAFLSDIQLPETPCFCSSTEEVIHYINKHQPPFILKTPFSSSGRGFLTGAASDLGIAGIRAQ